MDAMTTTTFLFYKGFSLPELVEPGSKGRSVDFYTAKGRAVVESARSLRPSASGRAIAEQLMSTVDGLCNELRAEFGSDGAPVDGLRQVRKLWRRDFERKHATWFDYITALTILGEVQDDDLHGWQVYHTDEQAAREMFANFADQVYDTCVRCAKQGSFRRCPCSKRIRYCGTTCSRLHWYEHKPHHKRAMAKLAAAEKSTSRAHGKADLS